MFQKSVISTLILFRVISIHRIFGHKPSRVLGDPAGEVYSCSVNEKKKKRFCKFSQCKISIGKFHADFYTFLAEIFIFKF